MRKVLNAKIYVAGDARERALDSARGVIADRVPNWSSNTRSNSARTTVWRSAA